jgi:monofunctional biosynthetic peptidoglycan transglycosylase
VSEPQPLRAPQVFTHDYAPAEPPRRRRFRPWRWLLFLFLLAFLTPPGVVLTLRWLPPPTSAFMLRSPTQPVDYVWVPAAQHPQTLRDAVIAAEDQKFYTHFGFDLAAIEAALEHNQKSSRKRGASTITQQVAKNLFMWQGQTYLRKGIEATFTILIELCWPKDRILEVYLNIAEFGPGTYGVEAAARKFFDKSAQELTPTESARLAAVLPSPRKWSARRPGPYVQTRIDWILAKIGYGPRPLPEPGLEPGLLEELPPEVPATIEELPGEMPEAEPGFDAPVEGEPAPEDPAAPAGGTTDAAADAPAEAPAEAPPETAAPPADQPPAETEAPAGPATPPTEPPPTP